MNKTTVLLFLAVFLAALFLSCSPAAEVIQQSNTGTYIDFIGTGKRIAVQAGGIYGSVALDLFQAISAPEYFTIADMLEALRMGRVDAVLLSQEYVRQLQDSGMYPNVEYIWVPQDVFVQKAGPIFYTTELRDKYNEWFRDIAADGTWQKVIDRWIGVPLPAQEDIPQFEFTGENGILRAADTGNYPPLIYFDANGEPAGFDVEMVSLFAQHIGMKPEFTMMSYDAIIPYVITGRADMSAATLAITSERQEGVIFGDPSVITQAVLIVQSQTHGSPDSAAPVTELSQSSSGIIEWLRTGIQRNLITDNRWKMIVNGLGVTLTIAFLAQIFGTVFGCFICYVLMRKNKSVNLTGRIYCGLIYGTPIVVLLMITYYIIFGNTNISNVLVAVAAFTMITGAMIAQNLKGAIDTVDPVEIEAARSIGFSAFGAFTSVTLPQAVRRALPGYTNGFVELVKATAIVGYIAIQDLTRAGDIIRSRTYDAYFPLLFVAAIYLSVTSICVLLFKLIVKKINRGEE
ncbi:MAG: ABC transporter permease subunit [Treponema sp.]|nr:ABC transporter permease subunit [Treponema sp.]